MPATGSRTSSSLTSTARRSRRAASGLAHAGRPRLARLRSRYRPRLRRRRPPRSSSSPSGRRRALRPPGPAWRADADPGRPAAGALAVGLAALPALAGPALAAAWPAWPWRGCRRRRRRRVAVGAAGVVGSRRAAVAACAARPSLAGRPGRLRRRGRPALVGGSGRSCERGSRSSSASRRVRLGASLPARCWRAGGRSARSPGVLRRAGPGREVARSVASARPAATGAGVLGRCRWRRWRSRRRASRGAGRGSAGASAPAAEPCGRSRRPARSLMASTRSLLRILDVPVTPSCVASACSSAGASRRSRRPGWYRP